MLTRRNFPLRGRKKADFKSNKAAADLRGRPRPPGPERRRGRRPREAALPTASRRVTTAIAAKFSQVLPKPTSAKIVVISRPVRGAHPRGPGSGHRPRGGSRGLGGWLLLRKTLNEALTCTCDTGLALTCDPLNHLPVEYVLIRSERIACTCSFVEY